MKILSVELYNFGSYERLHKNFNNQGLVLVHGATGSGKSTLCDVIPWVLFGQTSKNGGVDEVVKWGAKEPTTGTAHLEIGGTQICVQRQRNPNDLFFWEVNKTSHTRGKDLNDTQKLINKLLGVNAETFLSGSYFHEFSQAAQFFITTAKNRRAILEQVVDLSFAKNLQVKVTSELKTKYQQLGFVNAQLDSKENAKSYAQTQHDKAYDNFIAHGENYDKTIQSLADKRDAFNNKKETDKLRKIAEISKLELKESSLSVIIGTLKANTNMSELVLRDEACKECGAHKDNAEREVLAANKAELTVTMAKKIYLMKELKAAEAELKRISEQENTYQEQIDKAIKSGNPYKKILADAQDSLSEIIGKIFTLKAASELQTAKVQSLELLADVLNDLRAYVVKNTVSTIEAKTNKYLNDHFDAEIRISLTVVDADKVEVEVSKDGNICSYTQLSKGQRQLLKLCFGITVMQAISNQHGVDFNTAMIDEALDGLSEQFKIKAYGLLQELALQYENVLVVEHSSELKNLFENKIMVELINGNSVINEEA